MKVINTVYLLIYLLLSANTDAQSVFQLRNPYYSPESFNTVTFISGTGWVFGNNGLILKSTESGANFSQQALYVNPDIKGQSQVNGLVCYIYDDSGRVFRTSNGGSNWIFNTAFSSKINVLHFISQDKGFAALSNRIGITTSGGINWDFFNPDTADIYEYKDIYFINLNTGYIGAINLTNNYAYVFNTTNSGLSWNRFNTGVDALEMTNMYFINDNGWCAGERFGKLFTMKTTNGGLNWSESNVPNNSSTPNNIYFSDPITGYVTTNTRVLKSTNGGQDWFVLMEVNGVNASSFINESEFYLVDSYSRVMKTINGGLNFDTLLGKHSCSLSRIQSISLNVLWSNGTNNANWKSTNGGANWVYDNYSSSLKIKFTEFTDLNTGYSVADRGNIFKTNNFGNSWSLVYPYSGEIFSLTFLNSDTGWAFSNESIIKTTNGGIQWIEIPNNNSIIRAVFFDGQTVYGSNGISLFKSTNGGVNWIQVFDTAIRDYDFINLLTGWIISEGDSTSVIMRTSDGGMNWSEISTIFGNIQNIKFLDFNTGYLLSYNKIYRSTNGGSTWRFVSFPTSLRLFGFDFTDSNTGWVCGENSLIMKLTDGGAIFINTVSENVEIMRLFQNYPNPFNAETCISFTLANTQFTSLKVYDLKGTEIAELLNEELISGRHDVRFNAAGLSSGIYFYVLKSGDKILTKKFVLVK
ncbi:MAG: T9SS type A sorting domain-containing protein [Candidatus Kapaibacterium sp.]